MFSRTSGLLKVVNDTAEEGEFMKNPIEVLRRKEAELERLQEEVEALRLVGKLLRGSSAAGEEPQDRGKILRMP